MALDAHPNFAYSTVATAPSPATSGTTLVVAAGDGSKFSSACNAVVWPAGSSPLSANAEIVRITAVSTDTLTITRAQESTAARSVLVGDQIMIAPTKKMFDDVDAASVLTIAPSGTWATSPFIDAPVSGSWPIADRAYVTPFVAPVGKGITAVAINVTSAGDAGFVNRLGVYNADPDTGVLTTIAAQGTVVGDSTGIKTYSIGSTITPTRLFYIAAAPQGSGSPGGPWIGNWGSAWINRPDDNGSSWSGFDIRGRSAYFGAAGAFTSSPSLTWENQQRTPYIAVRWA